MFSIVIPTFKEQETINATIRNLIETSVRKQVEIIVVDSSPDDSTINAIDPSYNVKILKSPIGRAKQMNLGARMARGDVLLFLHADTIMPKGWDQLIAYVVNEGYDGGGFLKRYNSPSPLRWINSFYSNIRARVFHDLLGDNCIFVKKSVYDRIGGYKEVEIMEDMEFCKELKRNKCKIIENKVVTSSRRFKKYGDLKTLCIFLLIRMLYLLGVDHRAIKAIYYR